ncbi:MAG: hypothetical protein AB1861_06310 [Cyanobacteriota bacterium]
MRLGGYTFQGLGDGGIIVPDDDAPSSVEAIAYRGQKNMMMFCNKNSTSCIKTGIRPISIQRGRVCRQADPR